MYLDYLTIIAQLEIAGIRGETAHAIATLFAEIGFEDRETAFESLQELIVILYHDKEAGMRMLEFAHSKVTGLK